ncbi:MAG: hypothetical protein OHK0029_39240 [Armatimonadaceae bacterium]
MKIPVFQLQTAKAAMQADFRFAVADTRWYWDYSGTPVLSLSAEE